MMIGLYAGTELAVTLPPEEFCRVMEIERSTLNEVLKRERKAPKGCIITKLPDGMPKRLPPASLQSWRKLWKNV